MGEFNWIDRLAQRPPVRRAAPPAMPPRDETVELIAWWRRTRPRAVMAEQLGPWLDNLVILDWSPAMRGWSVRHAGPAVEVLLTGALAGMPGDVLGPPIGFDNRQISEPSPEIVRFGLHGIGKPWITAERVLLPIDDGVDRLLIGAIYPARAATRAA
jgi:hypothetical protein